MNLNFLLGSCEIAQKPGQNLCELLINKSEAKRSFFVPFALFAFFASLPTPHEGFTNN
jgi:hypothetical protein